MMRWVVPVMASMRRSTRRATKIPPPSPSTITTSTDHCAAWATDAEQPPPLFEVASDQKPKAVAEFSDIDQRAVIRRVLILEPPVESFRPPGGPPSPRLQRIDIAADRLPVRRRHQIEIRAGPQCRFSDSAGKPVQTAPL